MKISISDIQNLMCMALSSKSDNVRTEQFINSFKVDDDIKLYNESKIDEVDSHVAWLMQQSGIPLNSKWEESLTAVQTRITNLMTELEKVAARFFQNNISIIALKNAGIAMGIYKNLACSPMGDIDLLVSTKDFHQAHNLLINDLGYTFKFRSELETENLEEAFKGGGTEYFKDVNGQIVWLELQWRPVAGRWIQPHNEPNGDDLFKNAVNIAGSKVMLLAPEDNLLQVSLHTAKHSYCRAPGFRLHSDVDRIVRFTAIDWETFIGSVKRLHVKTAVYFSLFFSNYLLQTPIPDHVLKILKPGIIKRTIILRLIQKAGFFNQRKKKFSKTGFILLNLALYDNIQEMFKALFPDRKTMKNRYNFESNLLLPYYHILRLKDLSFKRAKL